MKVGIMQPYFVPYIGYWQLLNAVDKYVIYDDVNYINRGWINRNRILINHQPKYFNIPMLGASQNKFINEISVNNDEKLIEKNLKVVKGAYSKAPYFEECYPIIEEILSCGEENLASYLEKSIRSICRYLDIETELIRSSALEKDCRLKGQDKILAICELLEATEYYNAIGGQELYSYSAFEERNIQLKFLQTSDVEYVQFGNNFQPNLSILDVMMFNPKEQIKKMLEQYRIITE